MALCVLTGDIVGSTRLSNDELTRVQATLARTDQMLRGEDAPAHFDLHRGDGWQSAFADPDMALRYALCFRAALRAQSETFETRVAIATGDEALGTHKIETTRTATFIASGTALDAMPNDVLMVHAAGGALQAATLLADHISQGWTVAQARAIEPFLQPRARVTQQSVAEALGISRQAVGQALDAAGFFVIKSALSALEKQAK